MFLFKRIELSPYLLDIRFNIYLLSLYNVKTHRLTMIVRELRLLKAPRALIKRKTFIFSEI